jgi:hypothetical protein
MLEIAGEWRDAAAGAGAFPVEEPVTREVLSEVAMCKSTTRRRHSKLRGRHRSRG